MNMIVLPKFGDNRRPQRSHRIPENLTVNCHIQNEKKFRRIEIPNKTFALFLQTDDIVFSNVKRTQTHRLFNTLNPPLKRICSCHERNAA